MIDMDIQPQRVIFRQHVTEFLGNTHRHEYRHAGTNADNLNMWNLTQAAENLFKDFGRENKGITAREQHIAHLWCAFEIFELHLKFLTREGLSGVADDARARAITAIRRALSRYQHENPVRIPMNKPWHGRVAIFRKRVFHHRGKGLHLLRARDDLFANWIVGIVRVNQGYEVRRDIYAEQTAGVQCLSFRISQRDDLLEIFNCIQAMAQLPAPIVPFFIRNIGVDWSTLRNKWGGHVIFPPNMFKN